MKTIPDNCTASLAIKFGTEPIIIIEVDWSDSEPIAKYADKDYHEAKGSILQVAGFDTTITLASVSSSISVTLDDTDGTIKQILNNNDIHKRPCYVYQGFADRDYVDKFLLFDGEISSPIVWNEETRTVEFDVLSRIEDNEVGYSIEDATENILEEAVGRAWPIVFGSCLKVPAVRISGRITSEVETKYGQITAGNIQEFKNLIETYRDALGSFKWKNVYTQTVTGPKDPTKPYRADNPNYSWNDSYETEITGNVLHSIEDHANAKSTAGIDAARYRDELIARAPAQESNILAYWDAILNGSEDVLFENGLVKEYGTDVEALEEEIIDITLTTVVFKDASKFPQNTEITININGAVLRGTMSNNVFTVTDLLPTYTNLEFGTRLTDDLDTFWLADSTINIRNMYIVILVGSVYRIVKVVEQDGTKCIFEPFLFEIEGELTDTDTTSAGYNSTVSYTPVTLDDSYTISQASSIFLPSWSGLVEKNSSGQITIVGTSLHAVYSTTTGDNILPTDFWSFDYGDLAYYNDDTESVHIANLIPGSSVVEVLAYRTYEGVRRLQPVPSQYYDINTSYTYEEGTCTALVLERPLEEYGEGWEEQLYVSQDSAVGPNTVDCISWLLETYSTATVDATTEASVSSAIDIYPSHFALTSRDNVLSVVKNIAWLARLQVVIKQGVAYYTYIATEPDSQQTFTENDIVLGSMKMYTTTTEEIVTKHIFEWRPDYIEDKQKVIVKNRISDYGNMDKTTDCFIYNVGDLAYHSAIFWSIRQSNTWKKLEFTTPIHVLRVDTGDCITLSFSNDYVASSPVKALIESIAYDTDEMTLRFVVWVAVRLGEMTQYQYAWPASLGAEVTYTGEA